MTFQYVESRDRSLRSGNAAEEIRPGNLIRKESDGVYNATNTDGADGVAVGLGAAAWAAEDDEDFRTSPTGDALANFTYQPAANKSDEDYDDTVPYADLVEDGQRLKLRLPEQDAIASTAPNVTGEAVVGVIDEYPGRLVEEGYTADFTDDSTANAVTYNRSNGNFTPIGKARSNAPTVPVNEWHSLFHLITDDF